LRIRRIVFRPRLSFHRLSFGEGGEKRTTAKNKRPKGVPSEEAHNIRTIKRLQTQCQKNTHKKQEVEGL